MTMPLVISFFTEGYEPWAEQLVEDCDQFEMECVVRKMKSRGSWRANVGMKPQFIVNMLALYERPVVWLDADARIRQRPVRFEELAHTDPVIDFAAYFIPRQVMPARDRPFGKEDGISSGTMFFNVTSGSAGLLGQWIAREDGQHKYGQIVLGETWHTMDPKPVTFRLPQRYLKVYDRKWKRGEKGPVVIEHMQASRKMRKKVRR